MMPIKIKKLAPRPRAKPTRGERAMSNEGFPSVTYDKPKNKKINKRNGGDFNIEMKIPKDMVNQGVMYGYKKGGQV